jgi:F-type H+-transporting ATPase subunit alpha
LIQPEVAPLSVPEQLAVLLALTAGLFDSVPLEHMPDAVRAVHDAAAEIPENVSARFASADRLSDEDRQAVVDVARGALVPFQPKSESEVKGGAESRRP